MYVDSELLESKNIERRLIEQFDILFPDGIDDTPRNIYFATVSIFGGRLVYKVFPYREYMKNLSYADLRKKNLRNKNLRGCNLSYADLSECNLYEADLSECDLTGVIVDNRTIGYFLNCPSSGEFIGYKKCLSGDFEDVIVKLLIPEDALRSSATTAKCRCSKAKVLSVEDMSGGEVTDTVYSKHNRRFSYRVGEEVVPDKFDENRWDECSHGIHFFLDKDLAKKW